MKPHQDKSWDASYEWKVVLLMALGYGLLGIDRFMILPMFPSIMKDLHLDYKDLGLITGVLAVAWGFSAMFAGNLSDRVGAKKVLVISLTVFSLMAGFSGLAGGLMSLLVILALIGFSEGAFTPASIVTTLNASKPKRQGRNLGMQQALLPIMGLGVAPIFVTQLLQLVEWRWIFLGVLLPGLMVAFLTWKVLRQPTLAEMAAHTNIHDTSKHKWSDVFKYHNIPLNVICMLCWLNTLIALSAFLPSYLTDHLGLSLPQMGFVLSSIGFGSGVGAFILPGLSDRIGRKPVMFISVIGAILFIWTLSRAEANPPVLFGLLFIASSFMVTLSTITVGPLCAESVPPALMSTASGLVIGVAEIFGGGVSPVIAGYSAQHFGIETIFTISLVGLLIGLVTIFFLKETALARQKLILQ